MIGEEKQGCFKTYHFDYRGSTVAITDANGNITDTFAYDTYGKLISRTGTSFVIFGYNGRDGVVTDKNGLIYMRARYYSSEMRRFINADIVAGRISNAVTLNRFAYANGNPISNIDPFGLRGLRSAWNSAQRWFKEKVVEPVVNGVKKVCKTIENALLLSESVLPDFDTTFDNDEQNRTNDIVDTIIMDQDTEDVAKLKIGEQTMSEAGCEVIAVYNARIMLGDENVSLADTIEQFENQEALIMQPVLKGYFGSNPYSIDRVLEAEGLEYKIIHSYEEMLSTPGIYIVSVWNSDDFNSMIHTVAVEVPQTGEPKWQNGELNTNSNTEDIFITGYRVSKE